MNKFLMGISAALLLSSANFATAASHYISGTITNITAIEGALLINVNNGNIPDNCKGTPYNWLKIKQENTTMVSVVLAQWASNKRSATVYTSGIETAGGYCLVTQVDPIE
ncbi:hypothetical protein L4174_000490 [Photobacterium sp. CCB-ST2H9]|uniref:hypothetical protein n=1 Tax=Photobacterium sp. CCB-ST2H9 TaxID=2912855 RepID=UPI0020057B7B|nr:hypothetical protein [Photobacterium sp. CCB-ST2H9]UTM57409.1 hypothetical protein L4174_000490 [Photobacterium sp. CCB-ST2H9]